MFSINLCQVICIHNTVRRGERKGRRRDEQENRPKRTANKWSGRKNKACGREKKRARLDGGGLD